MTRLIPSILLAFIAAGCVSSKPHAPSDMAYTHPDPPFSHPASALVFDPPIAASIPPLDLSREPRQSMAFAGFQQSTTTVSFVRTDDRQSTAYLDSYDRRAITIQMGTNSR